jgi:metal-responsive CopG/Arc/MetJ family transcriptional regulator
MYTVWGTYKFTMDKKPSQMMHLRLDEPLLKRLDDFRFKYRFESRTEAFRWLVTRALDQKPVPRRVPKT